MQKHELKNEKRKRRKRIGRGGKRGTYSGRGIKGQKAHASSGTPSAEKELIARMPKLRGVKFSSIKQTPIVFNVKDLERMFGDNSLTREVLKERGIIRRLRQPVKILGSGTITKAFTVQGIPVSKTAREKIEKAGGKIHE